MPTYKFKMVVLAQANAKRRPESRSPYLLVLESSVVLQSLVLLSFLVVRIFVLFWDTLVLNGMDTVVNEKLDAGLEKLTRISPVPLELLLDPNLKDTTEEVQ